MELLAQSLGEYKCNAEKEKFTFFTASHIFLLVLHPPVVTGGIWERQALAHTALVYNNSSAARWCQKSILKNGKIGDESLKSDTAMASSPINTTASSFLSSISHQMSRALTQGMWRVKNQKSQPL